MLDLRSASDVQFYRLDALSSLAWLCRGIRPREFGTFSPKSAGEAMESCDHRRSQSLRRRPTRRVRASLHHREHRLADSEVILKEAIAIQTRVPTIPQYISADLFGHLADLKLKQGFAAEAREHAQKSLALREG